jgi:hypothetical protein
LGNLCAICQRTIVGTHWVCHYCAVEHGLTGSLKEWPEWARFCKGNEKNRRQAEARERDTVLPFSQSVEAEMLCYGDIDDDLLP